MPMTPYSTVRPMMGALPTWLPEWEAERIMSYAQYEAMYWDVPDTYKLALRGGDALPIYIPNPRIIVNTTNRYLAKQFTAVVDPDSGTPEAQAVLREAFASLFTRERFYSKFNMNKRYGLIRGDAFWHITADPTRPPGRRLSIHTVDPGSVFWITDEDDIDKIIGVHIIDQFTGSDNKVRIRRQTYRKTETGRISTELGIFPVDKWMGPTDRPEKILVPVQDLPEDITALPVYHVRNMEEPQNPYGSSELRGFERIMSAVNQGASDEELALALEGLGLYATTSGPPVDDDGNVVNWRLGPGRVVEIDADSEFKRVTGVGSVKPYQDHLGFLMRALREGAGTPDVAVGRVDVSVAESGIALALQMGPLLAKNEEKEQTIIDVHSQMFWDIQTMWLPAFESTTVEGALIHPVVGDPLPLDKSGRVKEIIALVEAKIVSAEWARAELAKLGYDIDPEMGNAIVEEQAALAMAEAMSDPFAARAEAELGEGDGGGEDTGGAGDPGAAEE